MESKTVIDVLSAYLQLQRLTEDEKDNWRQKELRRHLAVVSQILHEWLGDKQRDIHDELCWGEYRKLEESPEYEPATVVHD